LQGRIERRLRPAVQHQGAGGIDIGKVGTEWTPQRVVGAVGGTGEPGEGGGESDKQSERHEPHALARDPVAAAQRVEHRAHGFVLGKFR
jgi:hypothetical protein